MMKKLAAVLLCTAMMIPLLPAIGAKAAPENYGCDVWYEATSYGDLVKYIGVTGDACEASRTTKRIGIRLKNDITYNVGHLGIDDAFWISKYMGVVLDFNGYNIYINENDTAYTAEEEDYALFMVGGSLRLVDTNTQAAYPSGIYWQSEAGRDSNILIDLSERRGSSLSVYDNIQLYLRGSSDVGAIIYHAAGTVLLYDAALECDMSYTRYGYGYYADVNDIDLKLRADKVYLFSQSYEGSGFFVDEIDKSAKYDCCISDLFISNNVLSENVVNAIEIVGGDQTMKDIINPTSTVRIYNPEIADYQIISMDDPEYQMGIYSYDSGDVWIIGDYPDDVFADVSESAWYYDNVRYVANRSIMTGTDATHFAPAKTLNRAQFATVLYRMAGSPKVTYKNIFPDVPKGTFFSDAAIWASEQGIITGYTAGANVGKFGPGNNITREQIATMMYRYAQATGYPVNRKDDISKFPDANKVSGFAVDPMKWAYDSGIISGKSNGMLAPQGNAVRAECAAIIQRYLYSYDYQVD